MQNGVEAAVHGLRQYFNDFGCREDFCCMKIDFIMHLMNASRTTFHIALPTTSQSYCCGLSGVTIAKVSQDLVLTKFFHLLVCSRVIL